VAVVVLMTVVFVGLAMLGLALGAILRGRALHGSCRGPHPTDSDGDNLTCDHCTCDAAGSTPSRTDSPGDA